MGRRAWGFERRLEEGKGGNVGEGLGEKESRGD